MIEKRLKGWLEIVTQDKWYQCYNAVVIPKTRIEVEPDLCLDNLKNIKYCI